MLREKLGRLLPPVFTGFLLASLLVSCGRAKGDEESGGAVFRVGMECSYAPYNWTQPTDAHGAVKISGSADYAYGYDVMMAQKIAGALGKELEIVKLDWDFLVPAVLSGKVDCAISGQSVNEERKQAVDFTRPYYYAKIVTLVKRDGKYAKASGVPDLKGAVCTSQQNTVWYDVCLPQIPGAVILPAQESAPAMFVALDSGKCDAVVTDVPAAKAACAVYPEFQLLDFSEGEFPFQVSEEQISIAVSLKKGNDRLREDIDHTLSRMTDRDFQEMMEEAIEAQPLAQGEKEEQEAREGREEPERQEGLGRQEEPERQEERREPKAEESRMPEHFWGRVFWILNRYGASFLRGAAVTMAIALVGTFFGCVIGFGVGVAQAIPKEEADTAAERILLRIVRIVCGAYVEFFRGTPMMVQAVFIYYGAAAAFGLHMSMRFAAFFIVSVNTGAYMAETVRGGILSVDPGQSEGAKAIGMTYFQTMAYVILPQALRNVMPQIGNNLIINIKDTCVLSVIGTVELFYASKGVAGAYYRYFETYTITMALYFALTYSCSRLLRRWERKMDGPGSYDLSTTDTLAYTSGLIRFPDREGEKH